MSSGWNEPNRFFLMYFDCALTPWRLATAGTGARSVSLRMPTIYSSVNFDFFIPCLLSEASLSTNRWSENPGAGQRLLLKQIHSGGGRCRPSLHSHVPEKGRHMHLDRSLAQIERARNFLVRVSLH